jgi:hypothetical protein
MLAVEHVIVVHRNVDDVDTAESHPFPSQMWLGSPECIIKIHG